MISVTDFLYFITILPQKTRHRCGNTPHSGAIKDHHFRTGNPGECPDHLMGQHIGISYPVTSATEPLFTPRDHAKTHIVAVKETPQDTNSLPQGQIGLQTLASRKEQRWQMKHGSGTEDLPLEGTEELLLSYHPTLILIPQGIRCGNIPQSVTPIPNILQGRTTVKDLQSSRDIDMQVSSVIVILHIPLHLNFHTTENVDNFLKGLEIQKNIIVDLDPQQLLDTVHSQSRATPAIQFINPADHTVYFHEGIPGDGEDTNEISVRQVSQDEHGIGPSFFPVDDIPAHHQDRRQFLYALENQPPLIV